MAPLTSVCPGCDREVKVLPPRQPGHPRPASWRREAHTTNGLALNAAMARRCRYPVALAESEYTPDP